MIASASVFLYDCNEYAPNDMALYHARRVVGLIKMLDAEDYSYCSLFVYYQILMVVRVIIREIKRLRRLGDEIGASVLDAEVDAVLLYLNGNPNTLLYV